MAVDHILYDELGIGHDATIDQINVAYCLKRSLVEQVQNSDSSSDAPDIMRSIDYAYRILSSPNLRSIYDNEGLAGAVRAVEARDMLSQSYTSQAALEAEEDSEVENNLESETESSSSNATLPAATGHCLELYDPLNHLSLAEFRAHMFFELEQHFRREQTMDDQLRQCQHSLVEFREQIRQLSSQQLRGAPEGQNRQQSSYQAGHRAGYRRGFQDGFHDYYQYGDFGNDNHDYQNSHHDQDPDGDDYHDCYQDGSEDSYHGEDDNGNYEDDNGNYEDDNGDYEDNNNEAHHDDNGDYQHFGGDEEEDYYQNLCPDDYEYDHDGNDQQSGYEDGSQEDHVDEDKTSQDGYDDATANITITNTADLPNEASDANRQQGPIEDSWDIVNVARASSDRENSIVISPASSSFKDV